MTRPEVSLYHREESSRLADLESFKQRLRKSIADTTDYPSLRATLTSGFSYCTNPEEPSEYGTLVRLAQLLPYHIPKNARNAISTAYSDPETHNEAILMGTYLHIKSLMSGIKTPLKACHSMAHREALISFMLEASTVFYDRLLKNHPNAVMSNSLYRFAEGAGRRFLRRPDLSDSPIDSAFDREDPRAQVPLRQVDAKDTLDRLFDRVPLSARERYIIERRFLTGEVRHIELGTELGVSRTTVGNDEKAALTRMQTAHMITEMRIEDRRGKSV